MHASHTVTGLSYLPRPQGAAGTGSENGRIGQYKIETSTDGTTWTTAATGTWPDDATAKTATFAGTTAEFVRLDALTEAGNRGPWSSAAELNLTGS
jgi:galactose oxidase